MKKTFVLFVVGIFLVFSHLAIAGDAIEPGISGIPSVMKMSAIVELYDHFSKTTADNTVVKAGPGIFGGLVIVGGTMGTVTVYDNTSCAGTVIVPTTTTVYVGQVFPGGLKATTGICINFSAATSAYGAYK
jgi:hypothetical protein